MIVELSQGDDHSGSSIKILELRLFAVDAGRIAVSVKVIFMQLVSMIIIGFNILGLVGISFSSRITWVWISTAEILSFLVVYTLVLTDFISHVDYSRLDSVCMQLQDSTCFNWILVTDGGGLEGLRVLVSVEPLDV